MTSILKNTGSTMASCASAKIGTMFILEKRGLSGSRVLLGYNKKKVGWELPGGKLEKNEYVTDGAVRELTEETGYTAKDIILYGFVDINDSFLCFVYAGEVAEDYVCNNPEPETFTEWRWFSSAELNRELAKSKTSVTWLTALVLDTLDFKLPADSTGSSPFKTKNFPAVIVANSAINLLPKHTNDEV